MDGNIIHVPQKEEKNYSTYLIVKKFWRQNNVNI